MVEDRRKRMEEFVHILREQFQLTMDLHRKVTILTRVLEKDAQFQERCKAALQDLEHDDSMTPNLTRLSQIQETLSAVERLL